MYAGNFDFTVPLIIECDGVLSDDECAQIMEEMADVDWLPSTVNSAQGRVVDATVRSNSIGFLKRNSFWHDKIWETIADQLPERVNGGDRIGLGEKLRVYRYEATERFSVHTDQFYTGLWDGVSVISRFTFLLYLNDDFAGGETRFLDPEDRIVVPVRGNACLFQHSLEHEGMEVSAGEKWVLRSDVFYVDKTKEKQTDNK